TLAIAPSFSPVISAVMPWCTNRPGATPPTSSPSGSAQNGQCAEEDERGKTTNAKRHSSASVRSRSDVDHSLFHRQVGLRRNITRDHSCCMTTPGAQSMGDGWARGEAAMTNGAQRYRLLLPLIAIAATLADSDVACAQTTDGPDLSIELVDPKV